MTLNGILEWVDTVRPNPFTRGQKTAWINDLEASLWHEIFLRPMGGWKPKNAEEDGAMPLLLPDGWRRLYEAYLAAMMEFALGEFFHYENSMARYNGALAELGAWYAEEYAPVSNPARWVEYGTVTCSGADAEPAFLGCVPRNAAVLGAECRIREAFSPGCSLCLGTEEEPERLMAGESITPQLPGVYKSMGLRLWDEEPTGIWLRFEGTIPEQGQAVLRLLIQPPAGKGELPWK